MNTTIYTGPADGWNLAITARPAMGRWIVPISLTNSIPNCTPNEAP